MVDRVLSIASAANHVNQVQSHQVRRELLPEIPIDQKKATQESPSALQSPKVRKFPRDLAILSGEEYVFESSQVKPIGPSNSANAGQMNEMLRIKRSSETGRRTPPVVEAIESIKGQTTQATASLYNSDGYIRKVSSPAGQPRGSLLYYMA